MVEIRRCLEADIGAVMAFVEQHWRRGHVLATRRSLMDWQHKDTDGHYNFMLACDGASVLGVLGYIPMRRYDSSLPPTAPLWLALWKVRGDIKIAGLGLRMLRHLEIFSGAEVMGVNGINTSHPPMYLALGYTTGVLNHHYMIDPQQKQYLVSGIETLAALPVPRSGHVAAEELTAASLQRLPWQATCDGKSPAYFAERYARHPFYRYRVHHLAHSGKKALITTRVARAGAHAVLRIVDATGDLEVLAESGPFLKDLMRREGAAHSDVLNAGLPKGLLEQAGFAALDADGSVIVPNRYEPLEMKNHRVHFAIKTKGRGPFPIFRGDGDQDRPNLLP